MSNYTPGPWSACHNGRCKCGQVWSKLADLPVAKVLREVADEYPSIRFIEGAERAIAPQMEAYTEKIVYGGFDEKSAIANARLISAAPDLYEALNYIVGWMNGAAGDRNLLLDDAYNALAKAEGEIDA